MTGRLQARCVSARLIYGLESTAHLDFDFFALCKYTFLLTYLVVAYRQRDNTGSHHNYAAVHQKELLISVIFVGKFLMEETF